MGKRCHLLDSEPMLAVYIDLWAPDMIPGLISKLSPKGGRQCPWSYSFSWAPHEKTQILQAFWDPQLSKLSPLELRHRCIFVPLSQWGVAWGSPPKAGQVCSLVLAAKKGIHPHLQNIQSPQQEEHVSWPFIRSWSHCLRQLTVVPLGGGPSPAHTRNPTLTFGLIFQVLLKSGLILNFSLSFVQLSAQSTFCELVFLRTLQEMLLSSTILCLGQFRLFFSWNFNSTHSLLKTHYGLDMKNVLQLKLMKSYYIYDFFLFM